MQRVCIILWSKIPHCGTSERFSIMTSIRPSVDVKSGRGPLSPSCRRTASRAAARGSMQALTEDKARPPRSIWLAPALWVSLIKVPGRTAMPASGSSRRDFIKTMGVVAAAATCGRGATAEGQEYKPQVQKKLTQAAARYQDHPKGNEAC